MFGLPSPALYVGGALLVLLVASGSLNACQHRTIGSLRTEVGATRAKLDSAVSANESQSKSIDELREANQTWAETCISPAAMLAEAQKAAEFRARVESLSGELAKVKANASPDCHALLATNFTAACPAVGSLLRERANR